MFSTKEKRTFFYVKKKIPMATMPVGGLKALVAGTLRKELFFAASLSGVQLGPLTKFRFILRPTLSTYSIMS